MRVPLFVGAMTLACAPATAQQPSQPMQPATPPSQIAASATAEAKTTPDRATIEIGVQSRAATAAAAAADNARKQQAILDTLRKLGIPNENLATTNYSIHADMRHEPRNEQPRVVGYVVSNAIRADLERVDMVGRAIDAAVAKGSNTIHSLNFHSSKADDAHRRALGVAVAKARAEAEVMATAAGGSLGRLLELTSSRSQPPVPYPAFRMEAAQAMDTPIQPGQQTVTAFVHGRWEFVPGRQ